MTGLPAQPTSDWVAHRLVDQRGMTLVEMIVVLAIIGISASAAVLSLGAGQAGNGQGDARRLAARIQLAADAAMISDRALAVAITPGSYAIVEHPDNATGWQPTTLTGLGGSQTLPRGTTIASNAGVSVLPLSANADGTGFALTLTRGVGHWTVTFDGINARLADPHPPQALP